MIRTHEAALFHQHQPASSAESIQPTSKEGEQEEQSSSPRFDVTHLHKKNPSSPNHETATTRAVEEAEGETVEEDSFDNGNSRYKLDAGDHIYSWRGAGAWSHHGIVISVSKVSVAILDFYPERDSKSLHTPENSQTKKMQVVLLDEWNSLYGNPYKVTYQAGFLRRAVYRSGTCTSCESGPTFLVLARIRFLLGVLDSPLPSSAADLLPTYHSLHSNSETAAFWCKTGNWSTLQVADFLHFAFAGQVKSSVTLGAYVSAQTVTVPAAGVWGYLGFTTKVALATAQPLLLPLVAGYGLITAGPPLYLLHQCRSHWHNTTQTMHEQFWAAAPNELIVQCIQYWTNLANHGCAALHGTEEL